MSTSKQWPIPKLETYDVSPDIGFLPTDTPSPSNLDKYYDPWIEVVQQLPSLLANQLVRTSVRRLPVLSCHRLHTVSDQRCAYSMLAFLCHGYIWGGDTPEEIVPPSISCPFLSVSKDLGLPPIATYAAVCLWNYHQLSSCKPQNQLENLASQRTFTAERDESWFYNVSVAIEARGGPLMPTVLDAVRYARAGDTPALIDQLQNIAHGITDLSNLMRRMYEQCTPLFFYHRLRPYLAGSKNMGKSGLPYGIFFDEGRGKGLSKPVQYAGGSNAQSSLIQFLDIALGISHGPTMTSSRATRQNNSGPRIARRDSIIEPGNEPANISTKSTFLTDMRQYMPDPHRRFLDHFEKVANLRAFTRLHSDDEELVMAYDGCVTAMVELRDVHMQMVSRYIILPQAAAATATAAATQDIRSTDVNNAVDKNGAKGTGGTSLIPFLKQSRDETTRSLISVPPGRNEKMIVN